MPLGMVKLKAKPGSPPKHGRSSKSFFKCKGKRRMCSPRKFELHMEDDHFRYCVDERVFDEKFDRKVVSLIREMTPDEFTIDLLLAEGFTQPLIFRQCAPTGMRIPVDLTPQMVVEAAGAKSKVEVIDCSTQDGIQMQLGRFVDYFLGSGKESVARGRTPPKIYNLIDLEVTHTSLSDLISAPSLVRQIDWATNVWPKELRPPLANLSTENEHMRSYPKTQKYVLMSKAGSFTDFHVDFGGSSVWYHLVRGKKIFFLTPSSEKNRSLYAQWVKSGQHTLFLGDEVDRCERIEVFAGDTLMIPGGWIHAVYTMDDTLVVGGNFLHSFTTEMQLDVALLEHTLKVKRSIRYPFFLDLLWFILQNYHAVLGQYKCFLNKYEHKTLLAVVAFLRSDSDVLKSLSSSVANKLIPDKEDLLRQIDVQLANLSRYHQSDYSKLPFIMNGLLDRAVSPEIPPKLFNLADETQQTRGLPVTRDLGASVSEASVCDSWTQTDFSPMCCCHCPVPPPWLYWAYSGAILPQKPIVSAHDANFASIGSYNFSPPLTVDLQPAQSPSSSPSLSGCGDAPSYIQL